LAPFLKLPLPHPVRLRSFYFCRLSVRGHHFNICPPDSLSDIVAARFLRLFSHSTWKRFAVGPRPVPPERSHLISVMKSPGDSGRCSCGTFAVFWTFFLLFSFCGKGVFRPLHSRSHPRTRSLDSKWGPSSFPRFFCPRTGVFLAFYPVLDRWFLFNCGCAYLSPWDNISTSRGPNTAPPSFVRFGILCPGPPSLA